MKKTEKILMLIVALLFVGSLVFEGSMAMAIAHFEPFGACPVCLNSGGGGGF